MGAGKAFAGSQGGDEVGHGADRSGELAEIAADVFDLMGVARTARRHRVLFQK